MTMDMDFGRSIRGFMADDEARRLFEVALAASDLGHPCLEIGSYCGRSAYYIGAACRQKKNILFSLDHHTGSEEQQPGEAYFDPELFDPLTGGVNTFPFFRQTLERAGLTQTVVPVVAPSRVVGSRWATPLSMVFIDGGHTLAAALGDYETWHPHLVCGGYLVIHDIFMDPDQGGQAPRQVYEAALASGRYRAGAMTGTLGVLRQIR